MDVFTSLRTETEALAELVERHRWAPGPSITHHIVRLTAIARSVRQSVESQEAFGAGRQVSDSVHDGRLATWLAEQRKANDALTAAPPASVLPWHDGPLKPSTLAAAALTELFARGQDIADTYGVHLTRDDGVGHVAYYCVRTRDRAFHRHGLTPPAAPFLFELEAPSGARWSFGPPESQNRISGEAVSFCLVATGRRQLSTHALESTGDLAAQWLNLLQR